VSGARDAAVPSRCSLLFASRTSQRGSSSSSKHSRHESNTRNHSSVQSYRHAHSRDTTVDTSSNVVASNETEYESMKKKRKHQPTGGHERDNHHERSSKKHRRSSPVSTYASHRRQTSKHRRRSSSSSTRSSENNSYLSSNDNDDGAHRKATKGTLGSELDKLRPKGNQNKTVSQTTHTHENSSTAKSNTLTADNDVRRGTRVARSSCRVTHCRWPVLDQCSRIRRNTVDCQSCRVNSTGITMNMSTSNLFQCQCTTAAGLVIEFGRCFVVDGTNTFDTFIADATRLRA
jgi:hypothetical protein